MNFLYNNKSLIRVLQVTLWLYVVVYICSIIQAFTRQGDPISFYPSDSEIFGKNLHYYLQLLLTLANAIVGLVFCILFIVWFYRAYDNIKKVNPEKTSLSTGWTIGCWFVPIMNLFRPLRIMLEIWHGTQTAGEEPDRPLTAERSIQVNAWWYCWTFGLAIGLLGTYLQIRGISSFNFEEFPDYEEWRQNSIQAFKKVQFILLVSSILQLISLYMLNQLLNRLSKFEAELRERLFIAFSRQPTSYEPPEDLPR
jgi:heme/copper-type cytochrome/quinol oxidase subunit 2